MRTFLAVDIGASSGRHILGYIEQGRLCLKEIDRFPNEAKLKEGHLCWDVDALKEYVLRGLCAAKPYAPVSVGVDTWGVDYVLLDAQDQLLGDAIAYRDDRTKAVSALLNDAWLYARTGIAKQPFNTIYQLMSEPREKLEKAAVFLMMPDYLHFLLCGQKANEYTDASTTSLLNAGSRDWDDEVLQAAHLPRGLFSAPLKRPGTVLGSLTEEIRHRVGYSAQVVLPAAHDTGSAFIAVPARDGNAVYLSSGTWSLLGVENMDVHTDEESRLAGFTNEGGYANTIRYLKNIMGLWIIQSIRKEQNGKHTFAEMADMAFESSDFRSRIDVNHPRFLAPVSMIDEMDAALRESGQPLPESDGERYACVYRSLADCYAVAVRQLERLTGRNCTSLNIVGGGSQNAVLNQWTADATGLLVYAGPTEGTALGNIIAQMIACGELRNWTEARAMVAASFDVKQYQPMKG